MKPFQKLISLSILISGFLTGWFLLSSFIINQFMTEEMAESFYIYGFIFMGIMGFKLYWGIIGLLAFAIPAFLIWPGKNMKSFHKQLFIIIDLICLSILSLGMALAVFDFTTSWQGGNRDFFFAPIFILGSTIGAGLVCLIGGLVGRLVGKQP